MRTICLTFLLASCLLGQVINFDLQAPVCTYAFPTPCGSLADVEGVSWNGAQSAAPGVTIDTGNFLGMPSSGAQFLRNHCAAVGSGTVPTIPAGGPIPTNNFMYSQVYIPIPAGALDISFSWDLYSAEGTNITSFNDAMSIDQVTGCGGTSLQTLVYADTWTPNTIAVDNPPPCGVAPYIDATHLREVLPAGVPQTVLNAPIIFGATHIRITAANSADNGFPGHAVIDGICFNLGSGCTLPPAQPPPPPPCTLFFSAPCPGSLAFQNTPCPNGANLEYLIGVSAAVGTYPNGWYFGVDVPLPELINQFNFGYPFRGTLDGFGASYFGPIPCGFLPSGVQLWAATAHWAPGFVTILGNRPPVTFTIP